MVTRESVAFNEILGFESALPQAAYQLTRRRRRRQTPASSELFLWQANLTLDKQQNVPVILRHHSLRRRRARSLAGRHGKCAHHITME